MRNRAWGLAAGALVAAAGCVSSPNYMPPTVVVAPAYRALGDTMSDTLVVSARPADSATGIAPLPASGGGVPAPATASASDPATPAAGADSIVAAGAPLRPGTLTAERPDTAFWVGLGDTTLVALVHEALRASPDVHAAQSRLLAARGARRLSTFDLAPTVTAGARRSRRR